MRDRRRCAPLDASRAPRPGTAATGSRRGRDDRHDTRSDRGEGSRPKCDITSVIHASTPVPPVTTVARPPDRDPAHGSKHPRQHQSTRRRFPTPRPTSLTAPTSSSPLRLHVVAPTHAPLDARPQLRHNLPMDPLVIALAQLVRDRWANDQRDRHDRRVRLRLIAKDSS